MSASRPTWASRRPTTAMASCRTSTGSAGQVGGVFQGYTLGNILGAQFFAAALKAQPQITSEIEQGQFATAARLAHRSPVYPRREVHRR